MAVRLTPNINAEPFSSCKRAGRWKSADWQASDKVLPSVPIGDNLNASVDCPDHDYVRCYGHALTLKYPWVLIPDGKRHQPMPSDIHSYTTLGTALSRPGARLLCDNADVHCGVHNPFGGTGENAPGTSGERDRRDVGVGNHWPCRRLEASLVLIGVPSAASGIARRIGARTTWMKQVAPRWHGSDIVACFVLSNRYRPGIMSKVAAHVQPRSAPIASVPTHAHMSACMTVWL